MTMATVAYKLDIILERFWTALRLRRSKGPREARNVKGKKGLIIKIRTVGGLIKIITLIKTLVTIEK